MVREQPFFQARLSNVIEGIEFTVDQAVHIVDDRTVPAARPADAHDVMSTDELITDPVAGQEVAFSGPDLLGRLSSHHARLMAARPEVRPGQFEERDPGALR